MKSKGLIFGLATLSIVSLVGCKSNPDKEKEPEKEVEKAPETLYTFLQRLVKADDVVVDLSGTGTTTLLADKEDEKNTVLKGDINREIIFSDKVYLVNDDFGEYKISGGYYNTSSGIGCYEFTDQTYKQKGYLDTVAETYQDYIATFKNLEISQYESLGRNNYSLDLSKSLFGDVANNPVDFANFEVLSSIFKIDQKHMIVDTMNLIYKDKDDELRVSFSINYADPSIGIIPSGAYIATVKLEQGNIDPIVHYSHLEENKFEKLTENEEYKKIVELIEQGYKIKDFPVNLTNGEKLKGTFYTNKKYCVLDWTQEGAELLDGFFVKKDEVYSVTFNETTGLGIQKVISKKDILELNKLANTQITASDLAIVQGCAKFGVLPVMNSYAGRKGLPYVTKAESKDPKIENYNVYDFLNLYGIAGEIDSVIPVSLIYPGLRPLGYNISYNKELNNITVGWAAYGNNNGIHDIYTNPGIVTLTDFGATQPTMEKLAK